MNRTYLTRAIRELAGVYGYTIHTDTDDRTPREIVLLPAAWLPPIRLKEVEGRLHGRATYCGCCTPGQSSRPNGATRYGAKRNCNSSISSPS